MWLRYMNVETNYWAVYITSRASASSQFFFKYMFCYFLFVLQNTLFDIRGKHSAG